MFFKKMGGKKKKPLFTTDTLDCDEHQTSPKSQQSFLKILVKAEIQPHK